MKLKFAVFLFQMIKFHYQIIDEEIKYRSCHCKCDKKANQVQHNVRDKLQSGMCQNRLPMQSFVNIFLCYFYFLFDN